MEILYQGHGSVRVTTASGIVLFLDPCAGDGYDVPADVVLITHQHCDHNQVQLVTIKDDAEIFSPSSMLRYGEYQSVQIKGINVTAVPAYNRNHPKEECVGYVVNADGIRIYFAGDTSRIHEMKNLKELEMHYAFFPGDGYYNMDVTEAESCADDVGAEYSVPIHLMPYHGQQGALFSEEKASRFRPKGALILRPGHKIVTRKSADGVEHDIIDA